MKKILSFMTALLLAVVFTATGVHAANPSSNGTVTVNGQPAAVNVSNQSAAKNALFAFKAVAGTNTVAFQNVKKGQTYAYYKLVDGKLVKLGDVTATEDGKLTINGLADGDTIVVEAEAGTGAAAVPNTVDAE